MPTSVRAKISINRPTTAQRGVMKMVAKDILVAIKKMQLVPRHGVYIRFGDLPTVKAWAIMGETKGDAQQLFKGYQRRKGGYCAACAIGASVVACAIRYDALQFKPSRPNPMEFTLTDFDVWAYKAMSFWNLALMECAFELSKNSPTICQVNNHPQSEQKQVLYEEVAAAYRFGKVMLGPEATATFRLTAICHNILDHEGVFMPTDQTQVALEYKPARRRLADKSKSQVGG